MPETVYFLGAGVSREAGVPTQKELWGMLLDRWQKKQDPKMGEVLECAAALNLGRLQPGMQVDLAQFLTLIDLALEQDVSLGPYDGETLRRIRALTVRAVCEVLQGSVQEGQEEKFYPFCRNLQGDDTIVSFNYDTVIDSMLKRFCGDLSYGFPVADKDGFLTETEGQLLLKPHGSLNWLYCRRCNQIFLSPRDCCLFDGHPLREVLITPTYAKKFLVPQLHLVWSQSFCRIKKARRLFFVGYSFPPGDIHLVYLIKRAVLAGGGHPEIHIVGPQGGRMQERAAGIFTEFFYHPASFSEFFRQGI